MFKLFAIEMLQLIMSPVHGWEDVSYDNPSSAKLLTRGLLPWLIFVSVTSLAHLAFGHELSVFAAIHGVISTFLMFFITYFLASAILSFYVPKIAADSNTENHNNVLALYGVAVLGLIEVIKNCLPVDMAMVNFFPLYVLYILWRGRRYLKVSKADSDKFALLCLLCVVIPPYLLQFLFSLILP